MAAGVVPPVVDDGALDGEDARDVAGGGPQDGADSGNKSCCLSCLTTFHLVQGAR